MNGGKTFQYCHTLPVHFIVNKWCQIITLSTDCCNILTANRKRCFQLVDSWMESLDFQPITMLIGNKCHDEAFY